MDKPVAVVLLNYNSFSDCQKCILLLKEQEQIRLNIIVVDNCSSRETDKLQAFCAEHGCTFIQSRENRGYSAGNNIGLKYSEKISCSYAVIINPDMEIRDRDYISRAVHIMEEDSSIAALGTDIVNLHGQHQNPMREVSFWEEIFWPAELIGNRLRKGRLPYVENYSRSGYCYKLSGCCLFLRIDFLKQNGYLDEGVFLYCEEPILAAAVKKAGMREYYCAELCAVHAHRESEKGNSAKRLTEFYKSRSYYLKNYSGYSKLALKTALLSRRFQLCFWMRNMNKKLRRG